MQCVAKHVHEKDVTRILKMPSRASTGPNGATDSYLLLEDGSIFLGKSFGADACADGEVGKFVRSSNTCSLWKSEPIYICLLLHADFRTCTGKCRAWSLRDKAMC